MPFFPCPYAAHFVTVWKLGLQRCAQSRIPCLIWGRWPKERTDGGLSTKELRHILSSFRSWRKKREEWVMSFAFWAGFSFFVFRIGLENRLPLRDLFPVATMEFLDVGSKTQTTSLPLCEFFWQSAIQGLKCMYRTFFGFRDLIFWHFALRSVWGEYWRSNYRTSCAWYTMGLYKNWNSPPLYCRVQ